MRGSRDDFRNIALIGAAGLVGVLGTAVALAIASESAAEPEAAPAPSQAGTPRPALRVFPAPEPVLYIDGVRVRGNDSRDPVGDNRRQPLVYIDGVRVDESREALGLVDPDQVDRIEVLKGPAAKRIYGSEAERGVIQIFLKPGEEADGKADGSGS